MMISKPYIIFCSWYVYDDLHEIQQNVHPYTDGSAYYMIYQKVYPYTDGSVSIIETGVLSHI